MKSIGSIIFATMLIMILRSKKFNVLLTTNSILFKNCIFRLFNLLVNPDLLRWVSSSYPSEEVAVFPLPFLRFLSFNVPELYMRFFRWEKFATFSNWLACVQNAPFDCCYKLAVLVFYWLTRISAASFRSEQIVIKLLKRAFSKTCLKSYVIKNSFLLHETYRFSIEMQVSSQ